MKRTLTLSSVLLTLLLVLTACAGGGASPAPATTGPASPTAAAPTDAPTGDPEPTEAAPTDGAETPAVTPSPSPPPAGEEGTLTLWVDEIRAPYMREVAEQFTAQYGVAVAVHQLGFGDIRNQLVLRGPLGEGPDIIIGAHDWLGELVGTGVVAPLDLGAKAQSFDQVALQAFTYDGQLYGMPYLTEAIALYYNRDLVPEPPATWDELKQIAGDLQEAGTVDQGYVLMRADPYHSYPILSGMGGYIFGRDAEGNYDPTDVGLDGEGGLAYARELDSMIKEGLLRGPITGDNATDLFLAGDAAMFITGPWRLAQFREAGLNFGVAPIPTIDGNQPRPFVGVHGFMISADAPNGLLAQTFLTEFIATDEGMANLFEVDPRPPTWLPVIETVDDEDTLAFTESASNGDPMPAIPEMGAVWTSWTNAINFIFDQTLDPEQAMRDAAEEIRTEIGRE